MPQHPLSTMSNPEENKWNWIQLVITSNYMISKYKISQIIYVNVYVYVYVYVHTHIYSNLRSGIL